jgi:Met-zincin/Domain of unknown function (DUF5117)
VNRQPSPSFRRPRPAGAVAGLAPVFLCLALRAGPGVPVVAVLAAAAPAAAPAAGAPVAPPASGSAPAAAGASLPAIATQVAGLEKRSGLLELYLDRRRGKVWLRVPPPRRPGGEVASYLYVEGLVTGLGSNPVGLDRGQLGNARVVTLRRLGGRVLVEAQNLRFRAVAGSAAEEQAVRESFAPSVLWGGEVAAEDGDGQALVDFTSFVVRDAHDIVAHMKESHEGSWSLDRERSAADLDACLTFPENLELEALLTYASADPGAEVRATVPAAGTMTFLQHQSLLRLPDDGYRPRRFDPRSGSYAVDFLDYAAPLNGSIVGHWLVRHRLEKVDPRAARSPVKKPLVYYVDPATPEPVRGALLEGASWWKQAFDQAGFVDAFRVELLPAGVHPLDARYNVIEWVHRSTRGWSFGGGIVDPRTGEMVKGHVTLGSLRVRHDLLLFEGLLGADRTDSGVPDDPVQLALWRIRQLAAHEVGHALGLVHNFAASTYGRASVMDYPAPLVGVTPAGDLDVSHAYGTGVGEWDVQAIRYAYGEFPPGPDHDARERAGLDQVLRENVARGLIFVTDEDARPPGAAHPLGNLWDNGPEPVAGLEQALAVRRIALARFGERNLATGQPLATLQEVLAPLYFHHRYQLEAAIKVVGGLDYAYSVRGLGPAEARPLDAPWQRRALAAALSVLAPETLDLPERVVRLILPRPPGYPRNVELFTGDEEPAFDPLAAAAAAADMVAAGLLQRERAARLVDFHRRDPELPSLEEVLGALVDRAFGGGVAAAGGAGGVPVAGGGGAAGTGAGGVPGAGSVPAASAAAAVGTGPGPGTGAAERQAELRRVVQWVVVRRMLDLAADPAASPGVRARVEAQLSALRRSLQEAPPGRHGRAGTSAAGQGGGATGRFRRPAAAETRRAAADRGPLAATRESRARAVREARAADQAQRDWLAREIARFLDRRAVESGTPGAPPAPPPGQPIGSPGAAGAAATRAGSGTGSGAGMPAAAAAAAAAVRAAGDGRGVPPTLAGCSWDE